MQKASVDDVTPEERQKAKAINFGIIYGMTKYGLSKQLKVTPDEAEDIIVGPVFVFTD